MARGLGGRSLGGRDLIGRGIDGRSSRAVVGGRAWVLPGAVVDMDFANARYFAGALSCARASSKTNLLSSSASGFAYSTFLSNVLAITPGSGLLVEEARTNVLLNSTAPVTQTTASLAVGTYTLWGNGPGSATPSPGTATITGAGAATNGTPNVFVVTVAGTVTVTVVGPLNAFQCELGAFGTSLIVTAGATATRAADTITGIGGLATSGTSGAVFALYDALLTGSHAVVEYSPISAGSYAYMGSVGNGSTGWFAAAPSGEPLITPPTTSVKQIMTWGPAGAFQVSINGSHSSLASTSDFTSSSAFYVGSREASDRWLNGYIKRIAKFNTQLSAATMDALTV